MSNIDVAAFRRKFREEVGDQPKAFAFDTGISLAAVYNYLNGRIPATKILFKIANHTGRSMEWFLVVEEAVPLREVPRRAAVG